MTYPIYRATGYQPHPLDPRELKYAQPPAKQALADLSQEREIVPSPVEQQGMLGSCVGHAVSSALECLRLNCPPLSRRWVWQKAKDAMGVTGNVGVYLNTGCDVGILPVCTEEQFPYGDDHLADVPAPDIHEDYRIDCALAHQVITGDLVAGVWAALDAGHPVVVGTAMGSDGWYEAYGQGGVITKQGDRDDFYHALYVWRITPSVIVCRNSWGEQMDPAGPFADPKMTAGDIAFSHAAFRACIYEARELTPEAVIPEPDPEPEPEPVPDPEPEVWWVSKSEVAVSLHRIVDVMEAEFRRLEALT